MKKAIKSCALILSAVTLLTACVGERGSSLVGTGAEIPEYENESRELPESEALSFVKDMKIGWNLGNTLDADKKTSVEQASETAWGFSRNHRENDRRYLPCGFQYCTHTRDLAYSR